MKTTTFALLFVFILSACGPAPTPTATPIPPTATVPPPTLSSPSDTQAILAGSKLPQDLEELATETYSVSDWQQKHTLPYTIQLASNLRATWTGGWCATTQAILDQNLKQITYAFSINGQPVALSQFYEWSSPWTDDSGKTWACHNLSTVVSNWPKGVTTVLRTVITFVSKINDGTSDYGPGRQTLIYTVTLP